jgi:hypothetical protein
MKKEGTTERLGDWEKPKGRMGNDETVKREPVPVVEGGDG